VVRVRDREVQLLRLRVGHGEDGREVVVEAGSDLGVSGRPGRRTQDFEVPKNGPRGVEGLGIVAGDVVLKGCDQVDVVAGAERAGEQLVPVSLNLEGAEGAAQLTVDAG